MKSLKNVFMMVGLLTLAGLQPLASGADDKTFTALIVSAETSYLKAEAPLDYADLDADRVARAMRKAGRTPPGAIHRLKNPTIAELTQNINSMAKDKSRKFLFYFSGHSDENGLHLRDGLIDRSRFHSLMQKISANAKVVILDSCFSGSLKTKGVAKSQPIDAVQYNVDEPTGSVVLTSSSGKEFSYESENLKGSIFTYHLVSGIYGQADGNNDGVVTIDELYQYVYSQTKYQNMVSGGPVQHPEFDSKLTGQGALVVSFPAKINGRLQLPQTLHGELTLAAANGVTFFKFFKAKGEDRTISLPYGTYDVTVKQPERVGAGRMELLSDEEIPLREADLIWSKPTTDQVKEKGMVRHAEKLDEFLFGFAIGSHPGFARGLEDGGTAELSVLSPAASFWGGGWRVGLFGGSQSHNIGTTSTKVEYARTLLGVEAEYPGVAGWNNDWLIGLRLGSAAAKAKGQENASLGQLMLGTRFYPTRFPLKLGIHLGLETGTFQDSKKSEDVTTLGFSLSY